MVEFHWFNLPTFCDKFFATCKFTCSLYCSNLLCYFKTRIGHEGSCYLCVSELKFSIIFNKIILIYLFCIVEWMHILKGDIFFSSVYCAWLNIFRPFGIIAISFYNFLFLNWEGVREPWNLNSNCSHANSRLINMVIIFDNWSLYWGKKRSKEIGFFLRPWLAFGYYSNDKSHTTVPYTTKSPWWH